jgi:hypothetical protein
MKGKKKRPPLRRDNQVPDPDWAAELVDGSPEKAKDLVEKIDELAEVFGEEAAEDCRKVMRQISGKAMLRKVERENPYWDGKTRIVP